MPKNKTHSGAKKRFRVTGSGKIMRERANHVHKFHEKSLQHASSRERRPGLQGRHQEDQEAARSLT